MDALTQMRDSPESLNLTDGRNPRGRRCCGRFCRGLWKFIRGLLHCLLLPIKYCGTKIAKGCDKCIDGWSGAIICCVSIICVIVWVTIAAEAELTGRCDKGTAGILICPMHWQLPGG